MKEKVIFILNKICQPIYLLSEKRLTDKVDITSNHAVYMLYIAGRHNF